MIHIKMTSGNFTFLAQMEEGKAPKTCEWFLNLLPFKAQMIQARWSGQSTFIGLKDLGANVPYENPTSHPSKGEILMYPGKELSNGEILIPYGGTCFACPRGQISGNHFLTIIEGNVQLAELGRKTLYEGAQEILFEKIV